MTETRHLRTMTGCGCRDLADDMPARRYQIIVSGRLGMVCGEAFRISRSARTARTPRYRAN